MNNVVIDQNSCRTHVVTVGILNKGKGVIGDLIDKLDALMIGSMVNATLQDAAPMTVSGDFNTVGRDGIINELNSETL